MEAAQHAAGAAGEPWPAVRELDQLYVGAQFQPVSKAPDGPRRSGRVEL